MGIARRLLLRASRSAFLARQLRDRRFFRGAVRRFMPGEELEDALRAAAEFGQAGIGTVLTELGEQVTNRAEAEAVREHYLGVLDQIRQRGLPSEVSVKLSHLGLDIDPTWCLANVRALAARAAERGGFLWVDMEESWYVDRTLALYRQVRAERANVGVAMQAYLRRTPADVAALLPLKPTIRLVKGAYNEPPDVAFPRKADTDAQYFALAEQLLEATKTGTRAVFGTHDLPLIRRIRERAVDLRVPSDRFEIHMLYGIKARDQRALKSDGAKVSVLISYGHAWFAWYMRRLAERPANIWFVLRNLV
ncbi:MAG TPA: proline dehydrogenase family protein [Gemmatimonadales bacterium]|nr:proline dehydrogenase family protein [Gemmatimonadales bacterium]